MIQWPNNYDPTAGTVHPRPVLTPEQCMATGRLLAKKMITDHTFAGKYLTRVKNHYRNPGVDATGAYAALIALADPAVDPASINEHDFANVHRATWLVIVRALSRLVALNPFQSTLNTNEWADPQGGTEREVDLPTKHGAFFFRIPNAKGYYALTNAHMDTAEGTTVGNRIKEAMLLQLERDDAKDGAASA
jgi:hypothetical protein